MVGEMPNENLEPIFMHLVGQITAETDTNELAVRMVTLLGGHIDIGAALDLRKALALALESYGAARAKRQLEQDNADICVYCRRGIKAVRASDTAYKHFVKDNSHPQGHWVGCYSPLIRGTDPAAQG